MGLLDLLTDNRVLAIFFQTGGELITDAIKRKNAPVRMTAQESIRQYLDESDNKLKVFEETAESIEVGIVPQHKVTIKPVQQEEPVEVVEGEVVEEVPEGQAAGIATGCIPCSLGHFNTCSGLMNEAVRFAGKGMDSPEVVDRINMCLEETNALERVDLRPAMIKQLSEEWEQDLAKEALVFSRDIRHKLEGVRSSDDLIDAAAALQTKKQQIARKWFGHKLQNLTPEDQEEINRRLEIKLRELEEGPND